MAEAESISVQVAYARADTGAFVTVRIPRGQALRKRSNVLVYLGDFRKSI